MSFSKNFNRYKGCVGKVTIRSHNTGSSNTIDPQKMQAKNVVLTQWRLLTQLKDYLSKFSKDNITIENALNQEFAHFLQKIQPSIYGSELWRYFDSISLPVSKNHENNSNKQISEQITDLLNGFKFKTTKIEEVKKVIPKWKESKLTISKESVASRTRQILSQLTDAESDQSKLTKIEDLNGHIINYPEAKHAAVKEGAIRLLLKIKQTCDNDEVHAASNEALALLGYAAPVSGKGVRILSIDGGGVRGILVVEMLKKLEELTGRRVHEMFDLICGVSTGAIIASLIGAKQHTLDDISEIYRNLSTQIFTQSALKGTSSLVWSHSYYDTALWEKLLKEQMGEQTLISTSRNPKCPKLCALSAVVNQSRLSAYVFRNYTLPCRVQSQYMGGHHHLLWEAVRASAAAPTYFEEFKLGNMLHQDGGILFNNPTAVAIHEARLLWPETPIQCVLSFGTGRTVPILIDTNAEPAPVINSSWKNKFYAIIESATDTEGIHTMLSDLLPDNVYYRFNPYLTEMLDIAEINPNKLEQLKRDAVMYLRRNEDKFLEASTILKNEKSFTQKTIDWLNLQKEIHGLRAVE